VTKRKSAPRTALCLLMAAAAFSSIRAQNETSSSAAGDYVLGIEDRLSISVWKEPDLTKAVAIRPDGKITCPLVGDIPAAGRTAKQLTADLTAALSRYIKEPVVTVIVEEINNFRIYVLGEVARQGALVLHRRTRFLEAIALAGGLTQFANRSDLILIRYEDDKESRSRIDYRKILSGEKSDLNIFLRPGDTIIVN
jgi:polysaccharide biosynthesis/export protein